MHFTLRHASGAELNETELKGRERTRKREREREEIGREGERGWYPDMDIFRAKQILKKRRKDGNVTQSLRIAEREKERERRRDREEE